MRLLRHLFLKFVEKKNQEIFLNQKYFFLGVCSNAQIRFKEILFLIKEILFWVVNPSSEGSKPNFQSESIWIIQTSDSFGFVRIYSSDWIRLSRIVLGLYFIKRDKKSFSNWFVMTRNGSKTDFGMALIRSE